MIKRKRIGLLVGHADEKHQSNFIEGFSTEAFKNDYDVCVFATYNKSQSTKAREIGEANIFSLINYELFDGFVLLLDTIHTTGMAQKIEETIRDNFKGPVISVDRDSEYFNNVKIESYVAVKSIVSHLIEVHGYKDIAFLTGGKGHPHSTERLQAYLDCMEEHNLPVNNNRIFYGDFWYGSGKHMVERLKKDPKGMPEAIACANDYMAIDVAENLNIIGYRVPEDVAVTGYDSVEQGRCCPKSITSAPIPSKECGSYVANAINAMIIGEEIPKFRYESHLCIGGSCGCEVKDGAVATIYDRWGNIDLEENFYSRYNHMMTDLFSQTQLNGLINQIANYVHQLGEFDNFSLCLNSYWRDLNMLTDKDGLSSGFTKEVLPVLQCGNSITGTPVNLNAAFDSKLLFPELHEERFEPKIYYFTPLFFEERSFGYAVISYAGDKKCYNQVYWLWLRNVMHSLEGIRRISVSTKSDAKKLPPIIENKLKNTSFGERLVQLRNIKNISQEELADMLDVSRQSISKWENDKAYPEMTRLLMMSDYFEVSLDYLMRGFE